jgi:hypothetical protein
VGWARAASVDVGRGGSVDHRTSIPRRPAIYWFPEGNLRWRLKLNCRDLFGRNVGTKNLLWNFSVFAAAALLGQA